tara:strand:- start:35 stop:466 length:432 start_codon:yes stop_codon:yes gene_type:complete
MSWKEIMKAPTSNREGPYSRYRGNRPYSYIEDDMMEKIVKDLGLPETNEDGEKIEYEEEVDFDLVPSLKPVGNGQYELEIKFEGELKIWNDYQNAKNAAHTFTADDIEYESSTIEAQLEKPFSLDYEFSQYYNGKILLEVFVE